MRAYVQVAGPFPGLALVSGRAGGSFNFPNAWSKMRIRTLMSASAVALDLIPTVRNQSPKDKIAFPIKLNDRLTGLRAIVEAGDGRPTEAQYRVFRDLRGELDALLRSLRTLVAKQPVMSDEGDVSPVYTPRIAAKASMKQL